MNGDRIISKEQKEELLKKLDDLENRNGSDDGIASGVWKARRLVEEFLDLL